MNKNWVDLKELDMERLSSQFQTSEPFNHIVLDNFFNPGLLDLILDELNQENYETWDKRDHHGVQVKWRSNWKVDEDVPQNTFDFVQFLNSGNFLRFLTGLTGITGIIPDPYLTGGGFNQTNRGGMLGVHADGNWHDVMGVHRRLNVIVYLNKEWEDSWGGQLELWGRNHENLPDKCIKKIKPIFNRMCVFRTDDFSFHGHSTPLQCPQDRSRQSLILYYYTNTRPSEEVLSLENKHRALFYEIR